MICSSVNLDRFISSPCWAFIPKGTLTYTGPVFREQVGIKFIHLPTLEDSGMLSPKGFSEEFRTKWSGVKLTLPVRGITELHDELSSRGVKCTTTASHGSDSTEISVTDPDGNTIEFQEA